MKLGEKAELTCTAEYAYGDAGSPPTIPAGATLIFAVELLQINDRRPTRWMMSDVELITTAEKLKADGNGKFKTQNYKQAQGHYSDALSHAETVKNSTPELDTLMKTILQNMSVCTNNTGDFKLSVTNCTKAIAILPHTSKAYYLRSVAHTKLDQWDEANKDIVAAIKISPNDKNLRAHHATVKEEKAKASKKEAGAFKKFFAQGVYNEKDAPKEAPVSADALPKFDQENAQTYFDMTIGTEGEEGYEKGRVVFELFTKKVPKTAENFRALCTGEKGEKYHYKGNKSHRIINGFMLQAGDTTMGNGTGGISIYGDKFDDEGIWLPHTHKGVLSMANSGPNTNGSQFFICYAQTPHLNEKHTVYGRVISGYEICEKAENVETVSDKPKLDVCIADCGELTGDDKLTTETADFLSNYGE